MRRQSQVGSGREYCRLQWWCCAGHRSPVMSARCARTAVVHITWHPGLSPDESALPINHGRENNWIKVLRVMMISPTRNIRRTLNWYMATVQCRKRKRHLHVHHLLDLCWSSSANIRSTMACATSFVIDCAVDSPVNWLRHVEIVID